MDIDALGAQGNLGAKEIIRLLDLKPHPEGGHFRETFRDPAVDAAGRSVGTAIYYLLEAGEVSEWHRVDAAEIWHWYAGAPMVISMSANGHDAFAHHLGPVLTTGQHPQIVVPKGYWQSATSLGAPVEPLVDWRCTMSSGAVGAAGGGSVGSSSARSRAAMGSSSSR